MKIFKKTILMLAMIAPAVLCFAQPQVCSVSLTGKQLTIKDFARAYCSQFEAGSFERKALAAFNEGTHQSRGVGGCDDCVVDSKNGYVSFATFIYGTGKTIENQEALEMCYWNCDNKNEKLVAVNHINSSLGFDESFLTFYRYNVKTKKMRLIEAPFDHMPQPIDLLDENNASRMTVDAVQNATGEDSNGYQPFFQLPRTGTDISVRMSDTSAVPESQQVTCVMQWNGGGFNLKK